MEYELSCVSTVLDPLILILLISLFLIPLLLFFKIKRSGYRYACLLVLILGGGGILTIPFFCILYDGYGYVCKANKLIIKSYFYKEEVELDSCNIMITNDRQWRPKTKIIGVGTLDYALGYFKLENGKKAVYFRHKKSDECVVINASSSYYVIMHPGVEKLWTNTSCHRNKRVDNNSYNFFISASNLFFISGYRSIARPYCNKLFLCFHAKICFT